MGTKGDGWTTRGVPRLKRLGWGGWVVERNVVVRAKFLAIRRGTERFYPVSPPPLSDQECLSRLEWFIPSISGDYFIYRSGEGGTLLPLDAAAPRCVASRRISITSFSFLSSFAKLRSKRLARIIHHPVDVSVSGAFSKNYQISYPLEFLTRQLPLRGHKGSYFLNSSATRIPSGVWGVVSYTGCVCVCIYVVSSLLTGVQTFLLGRRGDDSILSAFDQFLTPLSMGNRCFFSFIEASRKGG